jgi:hypothetical protein
LLSDQQGFDRRWFAPQLNAVYAPTRPEQVADCVTNTLTTYGRDVKVTSGRHCYENFVYNDTTRAVIDMSGVNQVGFDSARNAYFIDAGCENWRRPKGDASRFALRLPMAIIFRAFGAPVFRLPLMPTLITSWTNKTQHPQPFRKL